MRLVFKAMTKTPVCVKTREFRTQLAKMLRSVQDRPVAILHHGNLAAVLVSKDEYEELVRLRKVYTTLTR